MSDDSGVVLNALQEAFGGMVIEYAVVGIRVDADGEKRFFTDTFEDQRCPTTLGLLEFAAAIERHRAVTSWEEETDP